MKNIRTLMAALTGFAIGAGVIATPRAQAPPVAVSTPGISQTPVFESRLSEFPGKRVTVFSAVFEPGVSTPLHRHTGTEFLYVLEGAGVVEMSGRSPQALKAGELVMSEPDPHAHTFVHRARNASATAPMRTLVFVIHDESQPAALPAE